MKRLVELSILVGFVLIIGACKSKTTNNQTTAPTKTVFTYNGGSIVLTDNPHIASVNGTSGNWSYVPDKGRRDWPPQPYYFVYYGNDKVAIISEGKGMIYFGTEDEAVRDERVISKWHEYRKHRE